MFCLFERREPFREPLSSISSALVRLPCVFIGLTERRLKPVTSAMLDSERSYLRMVCRSLFCSLTPPRKCLILASVGQSLPE